MKHTEGKLKQIRSISGQGLSIHLGSTLENGSFTGKIVTSVGDHDIRAASNTRHHKRIEWKPDEIKANAQRLVTCWNEHDGLVGELETYKARYTNVSHVYELAKAKADLFDELVEYLKQEHSNLQSISLQSVSERCREIEINELLTKAKALK